MILTGEEIARQVRSGYICIDPFEYSDVNPNSYNYHLGPELKTSASRQIDALHTDEWSILHLPVDGFVLEPGRVYLGSTRERIGSSHYVPSLIGRSSLGRLGVFLQISADLGNLGAIHNWTLEIVVTQPVRLYPGMRCGQVTFWEPQGDIDLYRGLMARHSDPHESITNAMFPRWFERQE